MGSKKKLKPSEFEKKGPYPFGGFGNAKAEERVKLAYRTGQDGEAPDVDLNKEPDDWGTGGLRKSTDKIL